MGDRFATPEAKAALERKLLAKVDTIIDHTVRRYYRDAVWRKLRDRFGYRPSKNQGLSGDITDASDAGRLAENLMADIASGASPLDGYADERELERAAYAASVQMPYFELTGRLLPRLEEMLADPVQAARWRAGWLVNDGTAAMPYGEKMDEALRNTPRL